MKKRTMLKCGVIGCAFLFALLIFSNSKLGAAPEKELKVGCIIPLSGPGAAWGIALKNGFEIAFDEINTAGGIKTSKGVYKPKLYSEDDQLKAELAVTRFNKLMQTDRIDPIVYLLSGAAVKALQPITTPKKIILTCCTQSDYEPQSNPYTFRSLTYHYFHQQVAFEWFKKNLPDLKDVVIINPDYTAGRDQVRAFREIAKKYDYKIINEDFFPMAATDFNPILTKLFPKKPHILHVGTTTPGQVALIVKQARELGFKGPIYAATRQDTRTVLEVAGPDYANDFYVNALVPGIVGLPSKFQPFYDEYVKRHGKFLDVSTMGHRTGYEIKASVESADGIDSEKWADAYRKIKIDSAEGPVHYGPPFGTQAYYPIPMTRIENGKARILGLFDPKILTDAEYLALGKP